MDQRISSRGSMLGAAMALFSGIAMLPVGIGMLSSYPDEIWPVGLLLVVPGAVIIYFSILALRKGEKDLKKTESTTKTLAKKAVTLLQQQQEKANQPVAEGTSSVPAAVPLAAPVPGSEEPLAVWACTEEEWKQFYQWEIQDRKLQAWATGLVVTFLGGLFIMFLRQAAWYVAFPIAAFIGAVYGVLSFHFFISSLGKTKGLSALIVFTQDAVMINNTLNPFRNDSYRLSKVSINDKQELRVMVIEYRWSSSRSGVQTDEIHIPIPKGKLGDAIRLMDHYNAGLQK